MPIPYMGSKRSSVGKIYQTIKNLNPEADCLYDLFCGGFAISEFFLKNGWKVVANDKNTYVIALLNQIINKGLNESIVTEWVSRDKFFDVIKNPEKYDNWYVGFIFCLWSFGNNQKSYLFGKEIETYKQAGHELVINKNPNLIKKLLPNFPQDYINGIIKQDDWHKRRIALYKVTSKLKTRIFELERLERLEHLEQLERLERLERLQQLELHNDDYRNISIKSNAIIYCDPPYSGKTEYSEGEFNYIEFWEWVREKSKTNKVYVSEYNAPNDFKPVLIFSRNSTLAGGSNKNQPNEKLFTIST